MENVLKIYIYLFIKGKKSNFIRKHFIFNIHFKLLHNNIRQNDRLFLKTVKLLQKNNLKWFKKCFTHI